MRDMPDFSPIQLPRVTDDQSYRNAIEAFKAWAGPHVQLGLAGVFALGEEGELVIYEHLVGQVSNLCLCMNEMYDCTLSYTAEASSGAVHSDTGRVEGLRLHMRIEPDSVVWITRMEIVELPFVSQNPWHFQLTSEQRKFAVAWFLQGNGVDSGIDVSAMSDAMEAEAARRAKLARTSTETQ